MPRHLFGPLADIIVIPMLLLQAVVTVVFFDRHYPHHDGNHDARRLSTTLPTW